MRTFRVKISGETWKYKALESEKYEKEFDDNSTARTIPTKKMMIFDLSDCSIGTVRHEVRHAYTDELGLESAELSADQMEEIQCSLDEHKWEKMNKTSQTIFHKLKELQKQAGKSKEKMKSSSTKK